MRPLERDEHPRSARQMGARPRVYYPNPEMDWRLINQTREAVRQSRALLEETDGIVKSRRVSELAHN
jgi:hypothetical protein